MSTVQIDMYKDKCFKFLSDMVQQWSEAFDDDNEDPIGGADFLDTFMQKARENGLTYSGETNE